MLITCVPQLLLEQALFLGFVKLCETLQRSHNECLSIQLEYVHILI